MQQSAVDTPSLDCAVCFCPSPLHIFLRPYLEKHILQHNSLQFPFPVHIDQLGAVQALFSLFFEARGFQIYIDLIASLKRRFGSISKQQHATTLNPFLPKHYPLPL
jgi:hypothetical protein